MTNTLPLNQKATAVLRSGRTATVRGHVALDGTRYVGVSYGAQKGYVPVDLFGQQKAQARVLLIRQGITIILDTEWNDIVGLVASITQFKPKPLVVRLGWSPPYFAFGDGMVIGPKGSAEGVAVYPSVAQSECTCGTLEAWKTNVGNVIAGQDILILGVLAALASPLVDIAGEKTNFGLELSGPAETGKSTWLDLFASVGGRPHEVPTFSATKSGLEDLFAEFRDMPFPIDEIHLADSTDKHFMTDLAFKFANGTLKLTRHQPDRTQYRFVFATTANQPISESLAGSHHLKESAALQRWLPIKVNSGADLGVFTFKPDGFESTGEFATYLADQIQANYGTPMRSFIKALVEARADDPEKLQANIRKMIGKFAQRAGIAPTDRGKTRATSAFGLFYAASVFARRNGILPANWNCLEACLAGYRNYQDCLPHETPVLARLLTIAERAETLDLRNGTIPDMNNLELARHGAFLKLGKKGRVELLLTDGVLRRFFPDWKRLKATAEFKLLTLSAKDHDGVQRQVRKGMKKERFVCFILPPEIVELLGQQPV